MFLARRPPQSAIDRFLRNSQHLPLSYGPAGILTDAGRAREFDEKVLTIGHGKDDFQRACTALKVWKQFNTGWTETFPQQASVEPGTVVAVLIRHLGLWSLNGCRVLYLVGEPDFETRFGFAYGTLTNHAEAGEEIFEVFIDSLTGAVIYRIRAISWPRATLARMGYPIVRLLQERFRRDSAAAMLRAMRQNG